jgi:SLT domain-containing protein
MKTSMTVGRRITLIAACFSLPIGVLFALVLTNIGEFVTFADLELKGNTYQRPLEQALQAVERYHLRLRTACAPKDPTCARGLDAARAEVDQALASLAQIDARLGASLQFTDEGLGKRDRGHLRVATLQKEWTAVAANTQAGPQGRVSAERDAQMAHLVADLRGFITHAGDTSNLILDPDLDSYYLMDVTLLALPQTQERLAKITAMVTDLLRRGTITKDERLQVAIQVALLDEADISRIAGSAQTAVNEDRNFYGTSASLQEKLPMAIAAYQQTAKRFATLTLQAVANDQPPVAAAAYLVAGVKALDVSFETWRVAVGELDHLLDTRIASYTSRRTWAVVMSLLALFVSCVLAWTVKRSITTPLRHLSGSLGPGAILLSECAKRMAGKDGQPAPNAFEMKIIVGELIGHADDMRTAVSALKQLVGTAATPHEQSDTRPTPGRRAA